MFKFRKNRLAIPRRWEDIDPGWVERALVDDYPGAAVSAVKLIMRDDGTNRRARIAIEYADGVGPERLFLKAHAATHRLVHLRNGNLFNEARLFKSDIALPLDHPKVYKSVTDYLHLDFLLVMEDLKARNADPRDATRPMSVEQVANGLRGLARLHSRFWGKGNQGQVRWVKTWQPAQGWQVGLRKRIPLGLERGLHCLPESLRDCDANILVDNWARYVSQLSRGATTLLHGDAHIGNTYVLPDNDVGFLDWQVIRRGNWSQDVGYFLVGSLTVEERREHERDLLEVYLRALELPDSERPSAELIWANYRASAVYGLTIWLSTLGTDGWQSPEICRALVERYASAYCELDCLAALAEMERRS